MVFLWLALAIGLGTVFAGQAMERRARIRESRSQLARIEENPLFFLSDESMSRLEDAVRRIPGDADLAAALSWERALQTVFLGRDADAWQKAHAVAANRMKSAAASPVSRIRAAGAPLLVHARTAETRAELLANLREALQFADDWPGSPLARHVVAAAAMGAGEIEFARQFLSPSDPEPFSWLYLEMLLLDRRYDEAALQAARMPPPLGRPWQDWIRCAGRLVSVQPDEAKQDPSAGMSGIGEAFPAAGAVSGLARACRLLLRGAPGEAVKTLRGLPPISSLHAMSAALRIAMEAGDMEAFGGIKESFIRRYGEKNPILRELAHMELMRKMEPELAWETFAHLQRQTKPDRMAAAAALLSGNGSRIADLRRFFPDLPGQDPPSAGELANLREKSEKNPSDLLLTALWLQYGTAALRAEDWGTPSFVAAVEDLMKAVERLPADSSWVMKKAARLGLWSSPGYAAHSLARLCGEPDADVERNPHFCTSWMADPEARDLYGRYLTAQEQHAVFPAWVWEWLNANMPAAPVVSAGDAFWQLRRLRYSLLVSPGHGREVAQKAAEMKHLETHPDAEVRTEYAMLQAALGDMRPAAALAADPRLPLPYARRLAHALIQSGMPVIVFPMLERILQKPLEPRARMDFVELRARARIAAGQDAVGDCEELFGQDPCAEHAALLVQAHLGSRDKNCRRIREVLERFRDHPKLIFAVQAAQQACP